MIDSTIQKSQFLIIRDYIHRITGIFLGNEKEYLVKQRLEPIFENLNVKSFDQLITKLSHGLSVQQKEMIITAITTNETSFFRDIHPFNTFYNYILPHLILLIRYKKTSGSKDLGKVTIWCVGASTGQEPYSLAMLINEYLLAKQLPDFMRRQFTIIATDIDESAIEQAKSGLYRQSEITRGLSEQRINKYFRPVGNRWQLDQSILSMVVYQKGLIHDELFMRQLNEPVDVIFSRNILIYFDEATRRRVVSHFHRLLTNESFLFLGVTESLFGYSALFESHTFGNTIFYRKR